MNECKTVVLFRRGPFRPPLPPLCFFLLTRSDRPGRCDPPRSFPKFLYDITVLISLARFLIALSSLLLYTKPSIPCLASSNLNSHRRRK